MGRIKVNFEIGHFDNFFVIIKTSRVTGSYLNQEFVFASASKKKSRKYIFRQKIYLCPI